LRELTPASAAQAIYAAQAAPAMPRQHFLPAKLYRIAGIRPVNPSLAVEAFPR